MTNLSSLVEILAKQALGGNTQQTNNNQQNAGLGGLGGVLGSVLGQVLNQNQSSQTNNQAGGLGGVLGAVLGQLGGGNTNNQAGGGSGKSALLVAVLPIILGWIQQQGGIQGALDKLKGAGLSSQVNSWVSPEHNVQNQDVAAEQMQSLFDDKDIEQIAAQTQEPKQNIYAALATALPQIIDSLTPDGNNTNHNEANTDIQNILQSISSVLAK